MGEPTEGRPAPSVDLGLLDQVLAGRPRSREALLGMLQETQELYGYLPADALERIAGHLGLPWSKVYAVATFYPDLRLAPQGHRAIRVCCGTACHVRGAQAVLRAVREELGIGEGEVTPDGLFSLDTEACLGACAVGPNMTVGDAWYGKLTPDQISQLLERHRRGDVETGSEVDRQ